MADVILCLGGNVDRNQTAAVLAVKEQKSLVLVSSEGTPREVMSFYKAFNVDPKRVFFDFNAWDTLTNFTETKNWILNKKPKILTVVTDDFHVRRSITIAKIVYSFNCISIVSKPHPSVRQAEADSLIRWDTWRSIVWRTSGRIIENGDKQSRMVGISAARKQAEALGLQII